ncbi:MAG: UDP-2,3-diacylglucosamine diphosphatase [bacterium]
MAVYFTSDQHITLQFPERGRRFARFLGLLDPQADRLVIAGDLCDFWFTAREARLADSRQESGLLALKSFISDGGQVTLLAGNHDQHLEWFYRDFLGLSFTAEPMADTISGSRISLAHGHLLGGRSQWKGWMESRLFLSTFEKVPSPVANSLARKLKKYNSRNKKVDNLRHYLVYKNYVLNLSQADCDIVILGHVHQTIFRDIDVPELKRPLKLAVLGHWFHQSSWLKLDTGGPEFFIWHDHEAAPQPACFEQVKGPE